MDYTSFPTTSNTPQPSFGGNQVDVKNIFGSGTLGGSTVINLGGPNGLFLDGLQGIYSGASTFAAAPFSVDLLGNVVANTLTITGFVSVGGSALDINTHGTTVDGNKITGASITTSQIASSTITGSNIAASTITGTQIASATISGSNIAASTITGTQIASATISGSNIASSTITGGLISGATITGSNIASSTITASNLTVSTLSAISANLGTITAGTINGTTITGATIRTASSGQRVILDTTNQISIYSANGTQQAAIFGDNTAGLQIQNNNGNINIQNSVSTGIAFNGANTSINGNTSVTGNLSCTGTKPFDIEHPDSTKGKRLRYIAIESPEVLVMCRGIADTEDEIEYPQHFIDISEPDSIQCQIGKLRGSEKISWLATGVRKGYADFNPEYYGESSKDWPGK